MRRRASLHLTAATVLHHQVRSDGRAEQPIAQFVGTLASVRVKTAGVPLSEAIPNEVPVAVLVGSWWPHPARRMTRGGNMNARFRWRDPDLADFPRHERWQRLLWTLLYGAFALMLLAVAILEEGRPFWFRFVAAGSAFGLLVWRARLLRRRPRFLDARQLHGGVRPSPD